MLIDKIMKEVQPKIPEVEENTQINISPLPAQKPREHYSHNTENFYTDENGWNRWFDEIISAIQKQLDRIERTNSNSKINKIDKLIGQIAQSIYDRGDYSIEEIGNWKYELLLQWEKRR